MTKTTKRFLYARAVVVRPRAGSFLDRGPGGRCAGPARTIEHLKRRFVEQGLEFALERKRRVRPPRKVIFVGRSRLAWSHMACSPAPPGRTRWTQRLLAEKVVDLGWVERVSVMTPDAKKNQLQPHRKKY